MGTERCGKAQSWLMVLAGVILVVGLGAAQAGDNTRENKAPKGGRVGKVVWIIQWATEAWEVLKPSDETKQEETPGQREEGRPTDTVSGSESDSIAQFFGIPRDEYRLWPERWQQALKQVHASPKRFRRKTIHTLKMLHASDWVLVEKIAPYAVQGFLFAEKAIDRGFRGRDIGVSELLELEAMGIIATGSGSISNTLKPRAQNELYHAFRLGDYGLVLWFRDSSHTLAWNTTIITRTGQELVTLLGAKPSNDYLHKLGEAFAEHGVRTELWEVTEIPGTDQFKLDKKLWEVIPNEDVAQ